MLQTDTLPASWYWLLCHFRSCFTAPTFTTFVTLVSGMIARPAHRTVTGMLIASGMSRIWHHSRAHRFFSQAAWSLDHVSMALLTVIVRELLPPGAPLLVAGDDTLFTRSGRKVHAAGWHHDASVKTPHARDNRLRWGNCWVVAGIVFTPPLLGRPVCLPVAFALWSNDAPGSEHATQSKQVLFGRLITMIAQACPDRQIHVVADSWYAGTAGAPGAGRGATRHRTFPAEATLTSRLKANTALHHLATPTDGPARPGRRKQIGDKIGTPHDLATHPDTIWETATVHRYGRTDTVTLADTHCLWYGVYRCRTIRVILLRDRGTTHGYGLAIITTDLHTPADQIISRYAARWSIETAFADAKQTTGVGEARNRTPQAVQRTVPIGLITQSLTITWHTLHGTTDITHRRHEAPWYRTKTRPAYHDMITQLRHVMIAAKNHATNPDQPTPQEIHAVLQAWKQAAA